MNGSVRGNGLTRKVQTPILFVVPHPFFSGGNGLEVAR